MFVQISTFVVLVSYNFDAINTQEKCRIKRRHFTTNLLLFEYYFNILSVEKVLQKSLHSIYKIYKIYYFTYCTLLVLKTSL